MWYQNDDCIKGALHGLLMIHAFAHILIVEIPKNVLIKAFFGIIIFKIEHQIFTISLSRPKWRIAKEKCSTWAVPIILNVSM